jgi:hypothetical protein
MKKEVRLSEFDGFARGNFPPVIIGDAVLVEGVKRGVVIDGLSVDYGIPYCNVTYDIKLDDGSIEAYMPFPAVKKINDVADS